MSTTSTITCTYSDKDSSKDIDNKKISIKQNILTHNQNPLYFALKYIDALIQNVPKTKIPPVIDLIFDVGGFNGLFGQGVGLYISRLEKANIFKVNRVSGASIGSLLALMYLTNIEYNLDKAYSEIKMKFHSTCSVIEYNNQVRQFVMNNVTNDTLRSLNNKLFITYYDVIQKKQIVVSTYNSREDLIETIIRSSHFPYLSDNTMFYKKQYMDGGHPYIFNDSSRPGLFIQLVTPLTINSTFSSNKEKNTHSRVIRGISDANDFFVKGKSTLCSYTNTWGIKERFLLRSRECLFFIIISLFNYIYILKSYIPKNIYDSVADSLLMQGVIKSIWGLYTDFVSNFIIT